jgi:hypothetical protein
MLVLFFRYSWECWERKICCCLAIFQKANYPREDLWKIAIGCCSSQAFAKVRFCLCFFFPFLQSVNLYICSSLRMSFALVPSFSCKCLIIFLSIVTFAFMTLLCKIHQCFCVINVHNHDIVNSLSHLLIKYPPSLVD